MGTLGERMKYFREQRGLSQSALARRAKVAQTRISMWELDPRAAYGMGLSKAARVADALGISLDHMIGESCREPVVCEAKAS